jgi:hypothetical protein
VDRRRLADVRAGTAGKQESGGSGYVVGPHLLLTCRHVIADDQGQPWPRLEVWLGHPGDGARRRASAAVVWVHPDQDAALLRIEGEPFTGGSLVRWGWFTGPNPVPYTGLGYPEFADYESGRGVEQLAGMLPPLAVGADGGFVLDQNAAPETAAGRAWPGISGAAVFCQGLLTAMVTRDDREFGNRRLHAVPVSALTREHGFARLVTNDIRTAPELEAVELVDFLQPPVSPVPARTPGSLLAAAVEAVEFTGRSEELAELAAWRDGGAGLSVILVTGEGGQGKTRLARHFVAETRHAGSAAGFLAGRALGLASGDDRSQLPLVVELARRVREAIRPVLLVADYAETRPDEIAALADTLGSSPPTHPVRVLLLSRTAGAWWANLTDTLGPHLTHRISLQPLTGAGKTRRDAYAAAVTGLARHLSTLPDSPASRAPGLPWTALAEQLAAHPPGLDDPRLGNALTLQITALNSLLTGLAGHATPSDSEELELIGHERGYLRRAAARRRLFEPAMLSDRSDNDERAAEAWTALERALAGLILLGPCDTSQAHAIGALASRAKADDVENWLAALYPPSAVGFRLGTVQPDRLAELLLGPILISQPGLLGEIGAMVNATDDAHAALFALMRTAAHSRFSQVGEQTVDLIASRPDPFAVAAPVLAATLGHGGPLREGVIRLGRRDPQVFGQTVYAAIDQLPARTVSGAVFSAALTSVITDILRSLARDNPRAYLPQLAAQLTNLANRLEQAGQRQAALAPAHEATEIYRQLVAIDRDAYLPELALSLNGLSATLTGVGHARAAFAVGKEATDIYRQLASANPDQHLAGLATALTNLSLDLGQAGQVQAAITTAQEATEAFRQLAAINPDLYLPPLALALNHYAVHLAIAEQFDTALTIALETSNIYRQLTAANPDAHYPDLASALINQGKRLSETGQLQAALATAHEATDIYQRLAAANPNAYLLHLSLALTNHAEQLVKAGKKVEAAKIWETALAEIPEGSSRLALTIKYAECLIEQLEPIAGAELIFGLLTIPEVPGSVEIAARRLLRTHWRKHPEDIELARRQTTFGPIPDWAYLTDDHIEKAIGWIMTRTWAESHHYFQQNLAELLTGTTVIVLDELALTAPADLIGQHRSLLDAIRERGIDTAYQALLLTDTLQQWLATPGQDASHVFLHDHPELLGEDIPGLLMNLSKHPDPEIAVHRALLTLARAHADIDAAYEALNRTDSLQAIVSSAIVARDTALLQACADIETLVQGRAFAGALHKILAWLLTGTGEQLPDQWASELATLAAEADPADKETSVVQFTTVLAAIAVDSTAVSQLRHILGLRDEA